MSLYHMTDIIPLLGLPLPKNPGAGNYNIPCPCCDTGTGKHLNINLRKDVFRCPVCDFHGGVFDLYAYLKNVPRMEVYRELRNTLGDDSNRRCTAIQLSVPDFTEPECPVTDIDIRHKTYSALLHKLQLADDHRNNLLHRGLSLSAIEANQYRTTPALGRSLLASQLLDEGHYLRGVPGFYRSKEGSWRFVNTGRGFLIPVRDSQGRILGMQLRLDKTDKRKYRWISSNERTDGTGAKGWVHTAGPVQKNMTLIEGGLKADIVHHFSGQSLIAVPGVSTLSELERVLIAYKKQGLESLQSGFDMDYLYNHNVYMAYEKLVEMVTRLELSYSANLWDPVYNGLDDYWKYRTAT
jgi:hypothetical protein